MTYKKCLFAKCLTKSLYFQNGLILCTCSMSGHCICGACLLYRYLNYKKIVVPYRKTQILANQGVKVTKIGILCLVFVKEY